MPPGYLLLTLSHALHEYNTGTAVANRQHSRPTLYLAGDRSIFCLQEDLAKRRSNVELHHHCISTFSDIQLP